MEPYRYRKPDCAECNNGPLLLQACNLSKRYLRGRWPGKGQHTVTALRAVSLELAERSRLAVVGRSGAGKSTLARCLCRSEEPDDGRICFDGEDFSALRGAALAAARRRMQLVFQHSATAISPRLNTLQAVTEPLRIEGRFTRAEQKDRAREMLSRVGLASTLHRRTAAELSGGQRQRLALARALICQPRLLILDEGLAGLDYAMQAHLVDLLLKLQEELAISCIFITHDLSLAAAVASEVAVMHEGRIVEKGLAARWTTDFTHPESLRLVRAWRPQSATCC